MTDFPIARICAALALACPSHQERTEEIDHRAILARFEQIIDLLRTCHVRDGWPLDEEGAEHTLRYFRPDHLEDRGQYLGR
jgi:hypothetical protein